MINALTDHLDTIYQSFIPISDMALRKKNIKLSCYYSMLRKILNYPVKVISTDNSLDKKKIIKHVLDKVNLIDQTYIDMF